MSPFQILLEVRRGSRFCKGGNLMELSARGGRNDDFYAESYYTETTVRRGCASGAMHAILGSRPNSPLELGTSLPVRVHMDVAARTAELQIGAVTRSGTLDPELRLVKTGGTDLFLVTSLEDYFECYLPEGGEGGECCHLPSLGWTYRNLRYTACR